MNRALPLQGTTFKIPSVSGGTVGSVVTAPSGEVNSFSGVPFEEETADVTGYGHEGTVMVDADLRNFSQINIGGTIHLDAAGNIPTTSFYAAIGDSWKNGGNPPRTFEAEYSTSLEQTIQVIVKSNNAVPERPGVMRWAAVLEAHVPAQANFTNI